MPLRVAMAPGNADVPPARRLPRAIAEVIVEFVWIVACFRVARLPLGWWQLLVVAALGAVGLAFGDELGERLLFWLKKRPRDV
jgi:hypothetical protein